MFPQRTQIGGKWWRGEDEGGVMELMKRDLEIPKDINVVVQGEPQIYRKVKWLYLALSCELKHEIHKIRMKILVVLRARQWVESNCTGRSKERGPLSSCAKFIIAFYDLISAVFNSDYFMSEFINLCTLGFSLPLEIFEIF